MDQMMEEEMEMGIAGDESIHSSHQFTRFTEFDHCSLERQFCFSGPTWFNRFPLKLLRPLPRLMVSENIPPTVANRDEHIHLGGPNPALVKAEVPWLSRRVRLAREESLFNIAQGQKFSICCMIIMTLNKFTREKFDSLRYQLVESGITSADILEGFVSLILEKAALKPTLCVFYAQLCSDLRAKLPDFPSNEPCRQKITFKQVLLNACQKAFEAADKLREELQQMSAAEPEMEHREKLAKLFMIGSMRFLGELYKKNLITVRVVHHMIQELLGQIEVTTSPAEENVERLCQLLGTVGKQLDDCRISCKWNDMYFNQMKELSSSSQLAPRMRSMLRNILDLRSNDWVPVTEELMPEDPWATRGPPHDNDRVSKTLMGKRYRTTCVIVIKLNRLASEMFNLLEGLLKDSGMSPAVILQVCVSLLHRKAVLEPAFGTMYAQLCSKFNEKLPPLPRDGHDGESLTVKRILLNNCQESFERTAAELRQEARQVTASEQETEHRENERHAELLGNVQFIGQLFMQKMVSETIIHHIVQELLGEPDSKTAPSDESVEAIYQLLIIVGKQLDERQKSREMNDVYFGHLKKLSMNSQIGPCSRFMIRDILDLRSNNWVTTRGSLSV